MPGTSLHPAVPWLVLALAVGVKLWRLQCLLRRSAHRQAGTLEQARRTLERIWAQS